MTRKWIAIPVVGFGLIAGSVGAYAAWAGNSGALTAEESSEEDELAWSPGSPSVQAFVRSTARARDAGAQWLTAEVDYAARRHDIPRLLALYSSDTPYRDNEPAALLTCRGLLAEESLPGLRHLRELWRGRETDAAGWLALDADLLILTGRPTEARSLLSARTFPGAEDAGRLARLALTAADASESAALLGRAEELAPGDLDVRCCRARWLQMTGRPAEAAAELATVLASSADDWVLRCQLAECYRRAGAYEQAVYTWMGDQQSTPADFAWLRAWFWNRVTRPVACNWEANAPNTGPLMHLSGNLLDLRADQFWDTESGRGHFSRGSGPPRQETSWLRLLALLQAGREDEADAQLRAAAFRNVSWQPDLEDALGRILAYRAGRPQRPASQAEPAGRHPFFEQLECLAADGSLSPGAPGLPADVARLLGGKEVFSAALLAAGWDEAALRLHHPESDLTGLPGWYNERLTRAIWANRSERAAVNFTVGQPHTPGIDLVAGELLVNAGRDAEALARLRSAAAADDPASSRAAWLLAETALRQGRPAETRQTLEAHPDLTVNAAGRALLARATAAEGNADRAEEIYRGLAGESAEARAYLARRAATGGDWDAAGRLLGDLWRPVTGSDAKIR
jgi:thioredoxin-like negative regulator of GroEL